MSSMAAAWYPCATKTSCAAASNCLRRAERGNRTGRPAVWVPLVADMSNLRCALIRTHRVRQLTAVLQHGSLTQETEEWAVDERGQPDSEPAGAGEESPEPPAAGWQPSANGAFRDVNGNRGDGVRRPPGIRAV